MDGQDVVAAFERFEAARAALTALPVDALSVKQLLVVAELRERGRRQDLTLDHALLTRLIDTATPNDIGAVSLKDALANRLHITTKDAAQRLRDARLLGPRHTLLGDNVSPELAHTAAALARGDIGADHVHLIADFIKKLPVWVDPAAREEFEALLANSATGMRPEQLKELADELKTFLDQDGTEPDFETLQRRREFTLGRQEPDGMSRITGWITPNPRLA